MSKETKGTPKEDQRRTKRDTGTGTCHACFPLYRFPGFEGVFVPSILAFGIFGLVLTDVYEVKVGILKQVVHFAGFGVGRDKTLYVSFAAGLTKHLGVVGHYGSRLYHRSALLLHPQDGAHETCGSLGMIVVERSW